MDAWLRSLYVTSKNYQLGGIVDEKLSNFKLTGRHQYERLKQRTELVGRAMDNGQVSRENMQALVDSITGSQDDLIFMEYFSALTRPPPVEESKENKSWVAATATKVKSVAVGMFVETTKEPSYSTGSRSPSDRDFAKYLQYLVDEYPVFKPVVQAIKENILVLLKDRIEAVHKMLENEIKQDLKYLDQLREQVQKALSRNLSESR